LEKLKSAKKIRRPFHLVVTNNIMPAMNGEDLGKKIKDDPELAGTHLVMMSSTGFFGEAAEVEKIGFAAYLTKPVEQSTFFNCLKTVLSGSQKDASSGKEKPIVTKHGLTEKKYIQKNILVVEDNFTNRKVAIGLLKNCGFIPDIATNGREAVEAVQKKDYDLIFMDCHMPILDGYAATAQIRKLDSATSKIPIIAMTANALKGDREECLNAGMDDYISKPISRESINQMLNKWLADLPQAKGSGDSAKPGKDKDQTQETTPPPVNGQPILDRADLLERLDGDEELAREVLEVFVADIPAKISALRQAIEGGETKEVGDLVHMVKGAGRNISAKAFQAMACEIEEAAKSGDLDRASRLIPELENHLQKLVNTINEAEAS
jgi:CheY-like chemotaxis protein/HPt (histidine-containing phosphotransfer) domain-containing protein